MTAIKKIVPIDGKRAAKTLVTADRISHALEHLRLFRRWSIQESWSTTSDKGRRRTALCIKVHLCPEHFRGLNNYLFQHQVSLPASRICKILEDPLEILPLRLVSSEEEAQPDRDSQISDTDYAKAVGLVCSNLLAARLEGKLP